MISIPKENNLNFNKTSFASSQDVNVELTFNQLKLREILDASYKCTKIFNIKSPEQAEIFFLGENHNIKAHNDFETKIINCLTKEGPVVVVLESHPSLQEIEKEEAEERFAEPIDTSDNLYYAGWDDAASIEIMQQSNPAYASVKEQVGEIFSQRKKIHSEAHLLAETSNQMIQEIVAMGSQVKALKNPEEFETPEDYFKYLQETSIHFDTKEELCNKINDYFNTQPSLLEKISQYNALGKKIDQLETVFKQQTSQSSEEMDKAFLETFPARTQAITETLSKIKECIEKKLKLKDAKIVFISGAMHLNTTKNNAEEKNFNLDSFYKEIKNHQAAIFIPKDIINNYIGF